jgi:hypothetical protein
VKLEYEYKKLIQKLVEDEKEKEYRIRQKKV